MSTYTFWHTANLAAVSLLIAGLALLLASCDFLDPTKVKNPQTTDQDLARAEAPVRSLIPGLRAQHARALRATVIAADNISDNYSIHGTGLGGNVMDFPHDITPSTRQVSETGATGSYWNLQELRALADFVLDEIAPHDEGASSAHLAEAHFYRGMAYLMQGENYVALPTEVDGDPVPASDLLNRAEADFQASLQLAPGGDFAAAALAGLARLHRAAGNATSASQYANEALDAGGDDFVFLQGFDATSVTNTAYAFLVSRALKEMQPNPRLDFLDPKYLGWSAGIPYAKAEEMHLILAEVALNNGDPESAREAMTDAVERALARPVDQFEDDDPRFDDNLNVRPRSAEIRVAADPESPFREGLVLTRPGTITVPTISGTSFTAEDIEETDEGELAWLLYTLRQEILFLEGRRMHDLGIRLPMMEREIDSNPNISHGDVGTEVSVPAYVPGNYAMHSYSPLNLYSQVDEDEDGNPIYELSTTDVTMDVDMNRVLAAERGLLIANPLLP